MQIANQAVDELAERNFRGMSKMPISEDRKKVFGTYAELIRLQGIGNKSGGDESWVAKDPRLDAALEWAAPKGGGGSMLQNIMVEIPPASRIRVPLINTLTMGPRLIMHTVKAYRRPSPLCRSWLTTLKSKLETPTNGAKSPEADEWVLKLEKMIGEVDTNGSD